MGGERGERGGGERGGGGKRTEPVGKLFGSLFTNTCPAKTKCTGIVFAGSMAAENHVTMQATPTFALSAVQVEDDDNDREANGCQRGGPSRYEHQHTAVKAWASFAANTGRRNALINYSAPLREKQREGEEEKTKRLTVFYTGVGPG